MKTTREIAVKIGYLELPGARVYYEARGSGPALLMIPGGPADATVFEPIAPLMANWYTVVTYDPRGLSHSKLTDAPDDRTLFAVMAEDASQLLTATRREPMYVFANSGGALIALELVIHHPKQVRVLVAHEPPIGELLPASERSQSGDAMQDVHETYAREGVGPAMKKFIAAIGEGKGQEGKGAKASPEATPEQQAGLATMQDNLDFFLGHYWNGVFRLDLPALKRSSTRIVVAAGEGSEDRFPRKTAVALAEALGTQAIAFPGEHGGFVTHPAEFAQRLRSVLAKN